jgi:phosphoglucan, water dikinase
MRTLSFSVTCASTRPGQSVGVAGSWSTWRPAGDFSGAAFPQWTGLVEVPDTGDPLEYKYVIVERGDVVRWEETASGRNRVLAAPADAAGGEPVKVDDGRFGGEHPTAVTAPPPPPPPPLRGGRGGGGGGSRFLDSAEVAALDTFEAALVDMNSAKKSWRLRLAFVRSAFCDPAFARQVQFDPTSVDCLVTVSAYLSFLASGQVPCAEDDGHHRPNHNAMEALQIEQALDAIVPPAAGPDGDETAVSWAPFVARSIYPQLPSHASQFTASVPLTRIRDIAHRGDIPHEMKQEIKHTLQVRLVCDACGVAFGGRTLWWL